MLELGYNLYFKNYLNKLLTVQYFFIIVALCCVFVLIGSYFTENILIIDPCILCTMQRILFIWIFGICIAGFLLELIVTNLFLKNFFTTLITNILVGFFVANVLICSVIGMLIAGRQSWLQSFAKNNLHQNIYSCSAGLEQLIMQHPIFMIFSMALKGTLECSQIHLKILGLSLANWSLIIFTMILLFGGAVIYKKLTTIKISNMIILLKRLKFN